MTLPAVPAHWTAYTSNAEVAQWLLSLRDAAAHVVKIYPNMIAFTDSRQKQRHIDSIPLSDAEEVESYKACATVSSAAREITSPSAGLVESNYHNASLDNAGEVNWHAVGLARVEQQYYIYSSTFNPEDYQDDAAPRIRTQHGCSNVVNLLDVIRSPKAVSVSAVKNAQGKAIKGLGKDNCQYLDNRKRKQ